jgi:hypothetical protein
MKIQPQALFRGLLTLVIGLALSGISSLPAQASGGLEKPQFASIPVQIVTDNDYALLLGNDLGPTSAV